MISRRLDAVRQKLSEARLHAFLVTHLAHVHYLTGFSGSNGACLIMEDRQYFLSDGRYKDQAPQEVKDFRIIISSKGFAETVAHKGLLPKKSAVGFEGAHLSVAQLHHFEQTLPAVRFRPFSSVVEAAVSVKEESEIRLIRQAVSVTERVFEKLLGIIKPGLRELDVAAEIAYLHRLMGADADAFEPIVASGMRGAFPHARASEKKICKGEMVTLDFGCRYKGYNSDLTRTVAVGSPSREMKNIYDIVQTAQRKAVQSATSGMPARALDRVARAWIKKKGYGKYFNHSLGHGLGREVHETPRISALTKDVLQTGNVVTIEPGIYVPGVGGVRIEDDVVIREKGCDILTTSSKALLVL
ncbi:MAG: aminopeptidase P family protein [Bacteroidota bacterium]